MKAQRWYEITDNQLHVYDASRPEMARSCSMTRVEDLGFYRREFVLRKVWED